MGRQLSAKLLETKFSGKKNDSQSHSQMCSPQERSSVRRMGSNYSPKNISKNVRSNSVSNLILLLLYISKTMNETNLNSAKNY
jgi:hypothetical protein